MTSREVPDEREEHRGHEGLLDPELLGDRVCFCSCSTEHPCRPAALGCLSLCLSIHIHMTFYAFRSFSFSIAPKTDAFSFFVVSRSDFTCTYFSGVALKTRFGVFRGVAAFTKTMFGVTS